MIAGAPRDAARTVAAGTMALVRNDARALLPIWLAGALAAAVAALTGGASLEVRRLAFADVHSLSLAACLGVILGLGAHSLGHEYAHRTLGLLLSLPLPRHRLFLVKQAVVAALVVPLATVLWLLGAFDAFPALPWLAAAASLGLAPLWTMVCRSPLAGAVFSASAPATVLIIVTMVGTAFDQSAAAEQTARDVWSWLMLPTLAVTAALGWRGFLRLEPTDGGVPVRRPSRARLGRSVVPRHPLWFLLLKELRLQRMAFAMAMLYAAGTASAALLFSWRGTAQEAEEILSVASSIYWLGLPVLAGSLATAEERQLGTLSWQLQLPTSVWQQWLVKAVTVFGVALVLGLGVPLLLARAFGPAAPTNLVVAAVLLTMTVAASLYVSSVCRSGVRAAVTSLTAIPLTLWPVIALSRPTFDPALWWGREGAWPTLVLCVVVTLLGFAFANHRPEPPAVSQIRTQVLTLGALISAGIVLLGVAPR